MENISTFCPASRMEWRQWLQENHRSEQSVWLLLYKLNSGKPTISWSEAVDEALCFGWVDSRRKPVDEEKFIQFFCQRKPNSTWSQINKEKVMRLTEQGLMQTAGLACIDIARQNGSWNILNEVEAGTIPADLEAALTAHGSAEFFYGLSRSVRKAMLQWLVLAKQPQTRARRIEEIAILAAQKQKPKQF
jgi:uncharacterized protein YdeI (YjbR/CyaY-like superfamily)